MTLSRPPLPPPLPHISFPLHHLMYVPLPPLFNFFLPPPLSDGDAVESDDVKVL